MLHDSGRDAPPAFYLQPEIPEYLLPLWAAFHDLTTERQVGMGLGPIPRSKVREYVVHEMGLDGDAAEAAYKVISKVDEAYLSLSNSKDGGKDKPVNEIPASDHRAVKRLFSRFSVRAQKNKKT